MKQAVQACHKDKIMNSLNSLPANKDCTNTG